MQEGEVKNVQVLYKELSGIFTAVKRWRDLIDPKNLQYSHGQTLIFRQARETGSFISKFTSYINYID